QVLVGCPAGRAVWISGSARRLRGESRRAGIRVSAPGPGHRTPRGDGDSLGTRCYERFGTVGISSNCRVTHTTKRAALPSMALSPTNDRFGQLLFPGTSGGETIDKTGVSRTS